MKGLLFPQHHQYKHLLLVPVDLLRSSFPWHFQSFQEFFLSCRLRSTIFLTFHSSGGEKLLIALRISDGSIEVIVVEKIEYLVKTAVMPVNIDKLDELLVECL